MTRFGARILLRLLLAVEGGESARALLQTRRSQCVVEIKRKNIIGRGIIDEVAEKIKRLRRSPDSSVRAALVYDGELAETVPADGYFDAIIPFRRLLGL